MMDLEDITALRSRFIALTGGKGCAPSHLSAEDLLSRLTRFYSAEPLQYFLSPGLDVNIDHSICYSSLVVKLTFIREIAPNLSMLFDGDTRSAKAMEQVNELLFTFSFKTMFANDVLYHHLGIKALNSLINQDNIESGFLQKDGSAYRRAFVRIREYFEHNSETNVTNFRFAAFAFLELSKGAKRLFAKESIVEKCHVTVLNDVLLLLDLALGSVIEHSDTKIETEVETFYENNLLVLRRAAKLLKCSYTIDVIKRRNMDAFGFITNLERFILQRLVLTDRLRCFCFNSKIIQKQLFRTLSSVLDLVCSKHIKSSVDIYKSLFQSIFLTDCFRDIITQRVVLIQQENIALLQNQFTSTSQETSRRAILLVFKLTFAVLSESDVKEYDQQAVWPVELLLNFAQSEYWIMGFSKSMIDILIDQDDDLFDGLLLLLKIYKKLDRCKGRLMELKRLCNPHYLFMAFLSATLFNSSLLLDFMINPDTSFLEYVILYFKEATSSAELVVTSYQAMASYKIDCRICLEKICCYMVNCRLGCTNDEKDIGIGCVKGLSNRVGTVLNNTASFSDKPVIRHHHLQKSIIGTFVDDRERNQSSKRLVPYADSESSDEESSDILLTKVSHDQFCNPAYFCEQCIVCSLQVRTTVNDLISLIDKSSCKDLIMYDPRVILQSMNLFMTLTGGQ